MAGVNKNKPVKQRLLAPLQTGSKLEKELPKWVKELEDYFTFVDIDKKTDSDGMKRSHILMQCKSCVEKKKSTPITEFLVDSMEKIQWTSAKKKELEIYTDRQIKGFLTHLSGTHADKYEIYKKKEDERKSSRQSIYSLALQAPKPRQIKTKESYPIGHEQQIRFENNLVNFIVLDSMPFDTPERVGFNLLMQGLDDKLTIPSRRTVGRQIDTKYEKIFGELKNSLKQLDNSCVHLIIDMWTSKQNFAVMGITAQYIMDWKLKKSVVAFKSFPESHTGQNIKIALHEFITETLGLNNSTQIGTITADNASNIIKSFTIEDIPVEYVHRFRNPKALGPSQEPEDDDNDNELLENISEFNKTAEEDNFLETINSTTYERNSCLAHLSQLGIKNAFNASEFVKALMKKVNNIVAFFGRSSHYYTKLKESNGGIALVKPCVTRWNSTYMCFKRIVDEQNHKDLMAKHINYILGEAVTSSEKTPASFTDDDIATLITLTALLMPLAEFTDCMQKDGITSSFVIPALVDCIAEIENTTISVDQSNNVELEKFKTSLLECTVQRFTGGRGLIQGQKRQVYTTDITSNTNYILAALLDPRIKTAPFIDSFVESGSKLYGKIPTLEVATKLLKTEADKIQQLENSLNLKSVTDQTEMLPPPAKKSLFDRIESRISSKEYFDEVERYLALPKEPKNVAPLSFWENHEKTFPILAKLCKKYLSLPASSGAVERLFSIAGAIGRARRARITIPNMEKTLCVRQELINQLQLD